jgi:heme/copper-type cytochrome/quinol oxidase subunit 2
MFPVVAAGAGIALALSGVALMAAVCLIIAVGITVYFAVTANRRREQGKTLGGWIIIPAVALYAVSIPYLLFFWWFMSH